ncbi:hypothetical protein FP507_02475 [Chlorobium phaeovibrioides]|uniref:Uncharacterized protein n=1 Tax=Chlorobium phaeovibrioides TaxID=1094 RepID=A0A5M8IAK0_CHLPH|nr:hypothetical protein [Chlorobium phaeovibrioides]KAA6232087.1 hypothetical protein FP507_02475 [Chlorobium phaeovibrioides]
MTTNTSGARSLSSLLGMVHTLPGESQEQYQLSLAALIADLGAVTVLQVYLAEKIHDCLWWIHRYEAEKRGVLIARTAYLADKGNHASLTYGKEEHARNALFSGTLDKKTTQIIAGAHHTLESIQQEAMADRQPELMLLDQQIALQVKILTGLQRAYEVAFSRKLHVERLQLQNELLRRDLEGKGVAAAEVQAEVQVHE